MKKQNGVHRCRLAAGHETNWLFLLMQADPALRLVGVSREGHACSIAAGLHAAGKKPLILIQYRMMESGDSIAAGCWGSRPVVMMVGYRGWTATASPPTARRPTPSAFYGVRAQLLPRRERCRRTAYHTAFEEAARTQRPVVVLVGDELSRFQP